jgi:hypothetical protein
MTRPRAPTAGQRSHAPVASRLRYRRVGSKTGRSGYVWSARTPGPSADRLHAGEYPLRQRIQQRAIRKRWVPGVSSSKLLIGRALVVQQCALERDLSMFAAGDETEIGEKGLTLSGGQKVGRPTDSARIACHLTALIRLVSRLLARRTRQPRPCSWTTCLRLLCVSHQVRAV